MPPYHAELAALSVYIAQRRTAILDTWSASVRSDPTQTTGSSLPRVMLHDHIPALLECYERLLSSADAGDASHIQDVEQGDAAAHGLHRWQQGFGLLEVTKEMGCLNECMVDELESYAAANPALGRPVMALARKMWAQQYGVTISASTSQYFRLQQLEASSHIEDLETALDTLRELEQQRAHLWQQAAHDLRGNVGVVANVTAGLASPRASEEARANFLRLLDRNVNALRYLLNDITSLARLQGGQELRTIERIDIAPVLVDLCESLQAQASDRSLFLKFSGPPALLVEGDVVKIRRIAQNLVLNAVKYTRQGGVTVAWGDSGASDANRWFINIADTGPGFHAGPGSALVSALGEATEQAKQVASDASTGQVTHATGVLVAQDNSLDPRVAHQQAGEGIGLSIVKRLCELLDATVQFQSKPGVGTTFCILLPRRYDE